MRGKNSPILFLLFCLLTAVKLSTGLEQETLLSPYSEAIHRFEIFVEERMAQDKTPGLSLGFLKGDFLWAKGYGYADLENGFPAGAESSYRLASITKTFTAIAILQQVEAGRIDLYAPVQKYVPSFPRKKWPVTVRHLLGHLGGISHYKNFETEGRIKTQKNTQESLAIFKDWDLVVKPGTSYIYSSYGYNLLGAVLEGATNESYGQYILKNIFVPLGMTNSRMDDPGDLIPNRVRGYRLVDGHIKNSEYVNVSSRFAAGGTRSTVIDLLKYAHGIIEGKLLQAETWDEMFTSMTTEEEHFTGYGMGWMVQPVKGHFTVSHSGSQPETRTHLIIYPKQEFAIAVASNLEQINLNPYYSRLAELILEEDIDGAVYVTDSIGQIIFNTCEQMFSHGLSRLEKNGQLPYEEDEKLKKAFDFFNTYVNADRLEAFLLETRRTIDEGFHPAGEEALIRLGVHMASILSDVKGKSCLDTYRKEGPLSFFRDYIEVSNSYPEEKKKHKLSDSLGRLLLDWAEDWSAVYSDDIIHLHITSEADPEQLAAKLRERFSGAKIFPDFLSDINAAARSLLREGDPGKALDFFRVGSELYAQNPAALVNLAAALLQTGDAEEAAELYRKAFVLQPTHSSLSIRAFRNFAASLMREKKIDEVLHLADIAVTLRPQNASLHEEVGDWFVETGKMETALQFYEKALRLDPSLGGIRTKIKAIEREAKKIRGPLFYQWSPSI